MFHSQISPAYEQVTSAASTRPCPPPPILGGGGGPGGRRSAGTGIYEELEAYGGKSLSMKRNQSYSTVLRSDVKNEVVDNTTVN